MRQAGGRIVAALAARFRDLDLAEEGFADACLRAAEVWRRDGVPDDCGAWLFRVAERAVLDRLRRRATRQRLAPEPEAELVPNAAPTAEEALVEGTAYIPDERLRLIFVCCHPAVATESRAALTLRLVCGLSVVEIARAFLLAEATLAQRLARAKRKIAAAGISFEIPGPRAWPERLDAVLSTLELAYSRAHEDSAGTGPHAGYAREMLALTATLCDLMPEEPEAHALAATIRFAEARRPARLDASGDMIPLSEQDPNRWFRPLIAEGQRHLDRALSLAPSGPRTLQAALQGAWCLRRSLSDPPPWRRVLDLYDLMLARRDDPFVRLNRAVALAEIAGPAAALAEVETLDGPALRGVLPWQAVRADLLRRLGRIGEAVAAYDAALSLDPPAAERCWLERRRESLLATSAGDNPGPSVHNDVQSC